MLSTLFAVQAEKDNLASLLAAAQSKLDALNAQYQDAVRQLNVSKFMLSDSDEARTQVSNKSLPLVERISQQT